MSFHSSNFRILHLAFSLILGGFSLPASAEDWPQWRGPDREGRSLETAHLKNWPEGGPPLAWPLAPEQLAAMYSKSPMSVLEG